MELAAKNKHERDDFIVFYEGPHIYIVHGEGGYTSVTTWVHEHFAGFDCELVLEKTVNSRKMTDPNYKYYGMTKDQIRDLWDQNRDTASAAGTKMHYDIECFYNGISVHNDSIEYSYFQKFVADHSHLRPYRTEWMVYYEELKISGSIDMVFENDQKELVIYDWKRCKEIVCDNGFFTTYAKTPGLGHLPDTNFWHYALQLNIYKTILEQKYGKKIVDLCLVCLHPDNAYKSYEVIRVPILEKEMESLLQFRRSGLSGKL